MDYLETAPHPCRSGSDALAGADRAGALRSGVFAVYDFRVPRARARGCGFTWCVRRRAHEAAGGVVGAERVDALDYVGTSGCRARGAARFRGRTEHDSGGPAERSVRVVVDVRLILFNSSEEGRDLRVAAEPQRAFRRENCAVPDGVLQLCSGPVPRVVDGRGGEALCLTGCQESQADLDRRRDEHRVGVLRFQVQADRVSRCRCRTGKVDATKS